MTRERRQTPMLSCWGKWLAVLALGLTATARHPVLAWSQQSRILIQDSTLNNLVDPPGYQTAPPGTLGGIKDTGSGTQEMILIPGLGFGGDVFDELTARWNAKYRMHVVTLSGFGGTEAPPAPADSVSFSDETWTHGALRAIEGLIAKKGIERPIIVGHWMTGTQLALRLAMEHPQDSKAVIIIAGSARFVPTDTTRMPAQMPLAQRVAGIDRYMAPRWFKTVTRETWDDNNFMPHDYAINPILGLRLWRQAAQPPLHVWVRYLCEFYAQDISLKLDSLTVPTLVILPGLEGIYHDEGNNYMVAFTRSSWDGPPRENPNVTFVTIPESRVCLWLDQPEAFDAAVEGFLQSLQ